MSLVIAEGDNMNPMNIIRFIRGFVIFEISGGFTERFINLCAAHKISIWNVKLHKNSLTACILIKNFRKLRSVAKKSGSSLKILKKIGLPVYLNKHKNRIGLLISLCFFAVFSIIMNKFVWTIEVSGTNTISHEEIQSVAESFGLSVGKLASSLDTTAISRQSVNYFSGQLQWMSINIRGSKAVIEVRDYVDEHDDSDFGDPCNVIADFDGVLLSVEVMNGDKNVDEGNAVKKGDLLISGIIENEDLSCIYTEARGRITASHTVSASEMYNKEFTEFSAVKKHEEIFTVDILGIKIPLGFINKSDYTHSLSYNLNFCYGGTVLPFGIIKSTYIEFENQNDKTNIELLLALDDFTKKNYLLLENSCTIKTNEDIEIVGENFSIKNDIECIDFIGEQSPIILEFYEN